MAGVVLQIAAPAVRICSNRPRLPPARGRTHIGLCARETARDRRPPTSPRPLRPRDSSDRPAFVPAGALSRLSCRQRRCQRQPPRHRRRGSTHCRASCSRRRRWMRTSRSRRCEHGARTAATRSSKAHWARPKPRSDRRAQPRTHGPPQSCTELPRAHAVHGRGRVGRSRVPGVGDGPAHFGGRNRRRLPGVRKGQRAAERANLALAHQTCYSSQRGGAAR